jgi:hypothetical protein
MELQQYLNEVKATQINVGNQFTLSGDIGNFKKGEKVEILKVTSFGNDIEIKLTNEEGTTDTFYLDKDDDFEEIN